ncbi:MAG: amino acid dehydrogenase [Pseudomonadota bacterium]
MPVFEHPEFDWHDQVVFCSDAATGLKAIVGIHDTRLGPAAGGCRMYPYASFEDALTDVLRLSHGMTYKNALAGLPLGGGKCVIIADPAAPGKAAKLRALGRHIQSLGGRYWTAVDVGIGAQDADTIAETADFVFARASQRPPDGLATSDYTALGAFSGLRACVKHVLGRATLDGVRVAVQGVGATGRELCRLLHEAGATLWISDVNADAVRAVVTETGATSVPINEIHAQDVDVFAPCALGAVINDDTVSVLRARIVCGIANNQLAEPRHGQALADRGIAYAPDYVVNAGGVISSARVIFASMDHAAAEAQTLAIYDTVLEVLERAAKDGRTTEAIADQIAEERLAKA